MALRLSQRLCFDETKTDRIESQIDMIASI